MREKAPCLHDHGKKRSHKRTRLMLTTGSGAQIINHTRRNGQIKELPKTVSLYNQNMGGVDLLEQIIVNRGEWL